VLTFIVMVAYDNLY